MSKRTSGQFGGAIALAAILSIGCDAGGGLATTATTAPTATDLPVSAIPTTSPAVLEDAGLEAPLPAGTYVSRLFSPAITLELGDGWFRRDAMRDRGFNLRRGPDGEEELKFVSAPDFLKCGTGAVIENPRPPEAAAEILVMPLLSAGQAEPVAVGERQGIMIRLAGDGAPVTEEDYPRSVELGCVFSFGPAPFPDPEANILGLLRDTRSQVVLVDVDGTTVVIIGRPAADAEAFYSLVLEVLASSTLG